MLSRNDENKIKKLLHNYNYTFFMKDNSIALFEEIFYKFSQENNNLITKKISFNIFSDFVSNYIYFCFKQNEYFLNFKRKNTKNNDQILILRNFLKLQKFSFEFQNNDNCQKDQNLQLSKCENKSSLDTHIISYENISSDELFSNSESSDSFDNIYEFPQDCFQNIDFSKYIYSKPIGSQNIHAEQFDDIIGEKEMLFSKQFDKLRAIILPEQGTPEWFEMRNEKISASDGGAAIGVNHYEPQYKIILKKTVGEPFKSNEYCYHGKKYEEIATMIYEYRMNVSTDEFGLISHPSISFLGASPDRICNKYKYDKKHLSKFVGRMLEIKCPLVRNILETGKIMGEICPEYYWVQVQLQLECCNLEECDFWQCEIKEYSSREEFIKDTNPEFPHLSRSFGFEKGCLIQLLPKNKFNEATSNYNNAIWNYSKFIYPPQIEMSPYSTDKWISTVLSNLHNDSKYNDYYFDKVIYWKLIKSNNVTIERDRQWFGEKLPIFQKIWNYITFFRSNDSKLKNLTDFLQTRKKKINKEIMNVVDLLYSGKCSSLEDILKIYPNKNIIPKKSDNYRDDDDYMFI